MLKIRVLFASTHAFLTSGVARLERARVQGFQKPPPLSYPHSDGPACTPCTPCYYATWFQHIVRSSYLQIRSQHFTTQWPATDWLNTENLYSPHMVEKYNHHSNGTIQERKKNAMAMQCQYQCNKRIAYYGLSHVKWTQQSLCMNFVRRRSSTTLGSA